MSSGQTVGSGLMGQLVPHLQYLQGLGAIPSPESGSQVPTRVNLAIDAITDAVTAFEDAHAAEVDGLRAEAGNLRNQLTVAQAQLRIAEMPPKVVKAGDRAMARVLDKAVAHYLRNPMADKVDDIAYLLSGMIETKGIPKQDQLALAHCSSISEAVKQMNLFLTQLLRFYNSDNLNVFEAIKLYALIISPSVITGSPLTVELPDRTDETAIHRPLSRKENRDLFFIMLNAIIFCRDKGRVQIKVELTDEEETVVITTDGSVPLERLLIVFSVLPLASHPLKSDGETVTVELSGSSDEPRTTFKIRLPKDAKK